MELVFAGRKEREDVSTASHFGSLVESIGTAECTRKTQDLLGGEDKAQDSRKECGTSYLLSA